MSFENIDLVIFDLYGTLIDSNGIHNEIDVDLVRFLGGNTDFEQIIEERNDFIRKNPGGDAYLKYCEFLKVKYKSTLSKEEILEKRRSMAKEALKKVEFKPNADKAIKFLKNKNYKLALATVSRREDIDVYVNENENMKNKCNLDEYFDLILTKFDVKEKKPNPEVYNKVVEAFKITDLSKCIVVEDSLTGIMAAKNAHLNVIAMYDKYADKDRKQINQLADYKVDNYEELINLFE